jgi:hypothetical protein
MLDRLGAFITAESLHPRYAKEVMDDLGKRLQPLGKLLTIQREKFDALLGQSSGLFFNLIGIACRAKARLNAEYEAITFGSPLAFEKFIDSCLSISPGPNDLRRLLCQVAYLAVDQRRT